MTVWLTPAQVAEITGRHVVTVRVALERGDLHGHQTCRGGRWRIHPESVEAWQRGMDTTAPCGCRQLRAVRRSA
jgi:excisionase family DNA binding protein